MWTAVVKYRSRAGGTIFITKRLDRLEDLTSVLDEAKLNRRAIENISIDFNHADPSISAEDGEDTAPCWDEPVTVSSATVPHKH